MCVNCSFLKHKTALQEMSGAHKLLSWFSPDFSCLKCSLSSFFFFLVQFFFSLSQTQIQFFNIWQKHVHIRMSIWHDRQLVSKCDAFRLVFLLVIKWAWQSNNQPKCLYKQSYLALQTGLTTVFLNCVNINEEHFS